MKEIMKNRAENSIFLTIVKNIVVIAIKKELYFYRNLVKKSVVLYKEIYIRTHNDWYISI